jgi:hypothetical protein
MTCAPRVKAPEAKLDYGIDWADGYLDMGSPPEIEMVTGTDTISNDLTETSITVEGGLLGYRYELVNEIVTSLGRRDQRSVEIRIANL